MVPGPERFDEIDGIPSADIGEPEVSTEEEGLCMYMILSSPDKLMVNITPPAISIIRDVLQVGNSSAKKTTLVS